jgi:jumonji domain-containing protein 2
MPPGQKGRRTATLKIPEYMTFRPTLDEMKNFQKYVEYMESQGAHKAGVAKIIPPPEWIPRKEGYDNIDDMNFTVTTPLKQHFNQIGSKGSYQAKSIVMQPMLVKDYRKLSNMKQYKTPAHTDYEDLAQKYWKTLTLDDPPIYGCDVSESLTDSDQKCFNIRYLNTLLDEVESNYKQHIRGVNSPYLYFGMWKTSFSWHVEDMDLHSINYLHFGMPKTWYVVPPEYGYLMERATKELFPNLASWCSSFMRHKTSLMHPKVMDQLGIPYQKVVQEERNAIIVFPYAYHSGFNHGFNCAESTNFALERWIEYGKRARQCDCGRSRVMFSMDVFVKKYQPDIYESWKNGTDIAPHPEDPPEVRAEFELRAKDPEAYAKLKREQLIKLNEKAKKARLVAPTLEDDGLEIEEEGGVSDMDIDCAMKVLDVYQHHELSNVKVAVDPESMQIVGSGKELLEEYLDVDNPEVTNLISQGLLIKIGEKNVSVRKTNDDTSQNSEFITKIVHVYQHIDMDLEAIVDPETFELFGTQMSDLGDFLGEDMNIKEIIEAGVFSYSYDAETEGPNPNYQPSTNQHLLKNTKRPHDDSILNQNKKFREDHKTTGELRFALANIFKYLDLHETITVLAHSHKVVSTMSEFMKRILVNKSISCLIAEGTLIKVGEKTMSFEETEDNFKRRVILNQCAVDMSLRGIEESKSKDKRNLKLELITHPKLNKSVFLLPTKNSKRETYKKAGYVIESEPVVTLFSENYLTASTESPKNFHSNEQSGTIERVVAALKNNCGIKKCDTHCDDLKTLSSHINLDNNNCSCHLVGVFKVKRMFLKDDIRSKFNHVIVTVNEFNESVIIEDLTRGQTYIVKQGLPPPFLKMEILETNDMEICDDNFDLQTKEIDGNVEKKDKDEAKIDLIQDATQKISSVTKFPKEIDDIRAPYDSEQEFEPDEKDKEKEQASLALALSMLTASDDSLDSDEESEDDPDYGMKGNNSFEWKTPKKKKRSKVKTPKKMNAGEIQVISQMQSIAYQELSKNSRNAEPFKVVVKEEGIKKKSKTTYRKNGIKNKPKSCLLKDTTAILEYFEVDDLNRIFNSNILAKTLNKDPLEVLAVLRIFRTDVNQSLSCAELIFYKVNSLL